MNQPWIYMYSPSWSPPPTSLTLLFITGPGSPTSLTLTQIYSFLFIFLFLFMAVIFHYIYVSQLLYPFIRRWTSRLLHWASGSFSVMVFSGYMPRSGVTGLYGSFIFCIFSEINLHTVLHSSYISLHSYQLCKSIPFSLHPFQHLLFIDFLIWPFWLVWGDTSM